MPAERFVSLRHSQAILTAVILCPFLAALLHHGMDTDVWRFVPVATSASAEMLAQLLRLRRTPTDRAVEDYRGGDFRWLLRLYKLVRVGAVAGFAASLSVLLPPGPWTPFVTGLLRSPGAGGVIGGSRYYWNDDILVAASVIMLVPLVVYELERVGITGSSFAARKATLLGWWCLLSGLGALLMDCWVLLDETLMAGTSTLDPVAGQSGSGIVT